MPLYVIEVSFTKIYEEFDIFISELQKKIARSIEILLSENSNNLTFDKKTDSVIIVSHEYLFGRPYEENTTGMSKAEANQFAENLQQQTDTLAKLHNIKIAIAPGTIIVKQELDVDEYPGNRAYFFSPNKQPTYIDKSDDEAGRVFEWNDMKICISICVKWGNLTSNRRPEADIYFITSAGYLLLAGTRHQLMKKPGTIYIQSDLSACSFKVYTEKDSVADTLDDIRLSDKPEHIKYLDINSKISSYEEGSIRVIKTLPKHTSKAELVTSGEALFKTETSRSQTQEETTDRPLNACL